MHLKFAAVITAAAIAFAPAAAALSANDIPADLPVSSLLNSAQAHLSRGETSDALLYYDVAITRDPSNYLTLFKRATTYLSLGRVNQATEDFNQVLVLKPGFKGAHSQLASIKARNADWDGARSEYKRAGRGKGDQEVAEMEIAALAAASGLAAGEKNEFDKCITDLGVAISVASRAASLREARYKCRAQRGDLEEASTDLLQLLHIRQSDTRPYQILSALSFFAMDDMNAGMEHIRKCLLSDPDSKVCLRQRRVMKNTQKAVEKAVKSIEGGRPSTGVKILVPSGDDKGLLADITETVDGLKKDGLLPSGVRNNLYNRLVELTCRAYYETNGKKAAEYCSAALHNDENSLYGLLWEGKKAMAAEDLESAVRTLTKANEVHPGSRAQIQDVLHKAQVALKRSKTKDYYKVLGVPSDADERTIKKAYRSRSKEFHPDKIAKHGITKEEAEKKMIAINEAYEVLSNPELRARFDRGDDPNDHEQQRGHPGGGGNPFGHFQFQGFPSGFPGGGSHRFHF